MWNTSKVNNNNKKTPADDVFIVNIKHMSHFFLVFLLLTLNK